LDTYICQKKGVSIHTKGVQKTAKNKAKTDPKNGRSLDTLAYAVHFCPKPPKTGTFLESEKDRINYQKKARSKYLTNSYLFKLIDLNSSLKKSYWSTYHCACLLEPHHRKNSLISSYCNQRWCLVCNRIRIAKMINAYSEPLKQLNDKQFVTLTNQNCKEHELKERIVLMLKLDNNNRQAIRRKLRKNGKTFDGVRKLECTYNPFTDTYNPHFHFIIDGKDNAEQMINGWLKRNIKHGIKVSDKAQHFVECNDSSMMELFKYFTKLVSSKGDDKRHTTAYALDTIFQAMYQKIVYQPLGSIRKAKVSEDIDTIQSQKVEQCLVDFGNWMWRDNDWYSKNNRDRKLDEFDNITDLENLCGYQPSDYDKEYGKMIKGKRRNNKK